MNNDETDTLNVLDIFCGCGGLSQGFLNAGFDVLLGIDNNESALNTFKNNHEQSLALNIDLFNQNFLEDIKTHIQGNIDVIIAGPPCQGFSLTGPRNFDDERNQLYRSVLNAVDEFKPEAFVIENVPGLATLYDGQIRDEIIRHLEHLDDVKYNVSCEVLIAANYGVPQIRKRLFFVGLKEEYGHFRFPESTHSPDSYITCEEAIEDLPARIKEIGEEVDVYCMNPFTEYQKLMRQKCNILYNHVATRHTQLVKDVISLVPEGGNHKDLPPGVGESRKFNEAWTRYHSKRPAKTIDTGHRNHFHYKYNRVPTIRENARFQSFPDSFRFYGSKTSQNRQVGNAVPPLLSYQLAKRIKMYVTAEKKLMISSNSTDQDNSH